MSGQPKRQKTMGNTQNELENLLRLHRIRLATREVREDFPLLRLHKSIEAYQIIATFHTIPVAQRMEVIREHFAGSTARDQRLRRAFLKRQSSRSIDQLEAMEPTALDLDEERCWQNRERNDLLDALIRQSERHLGKAEIRRCFLARFRDAAQSEILSPGPVKGGADRHEMAESLGSWNLVTGLEFGGLGNQYHCNFSLKHDHLDKPLRILSVGGLLGFSDLRWNDITHETLQDDAQKAVQLWVEARRFLTEFMKDPELKVEVEPGEKPIKPSEKSAIDPKNTPIDEDHYYYFVKYQPDVETALQELRQREFEAGRYHPAQPFLRFPPGPDSPAPGARHLSIDEALAAAAEVGTRSILDITGVADDPDLGVAAPFPYEELERYFGTVHPTKEMVAANLGFLRSIEPGHGMYLIVFEGERPSELFFAGLSFD